MVAQNTASQIQMPSMPEVTMPSMPTLNSEFYRPQMPSYKNQAQNKKQNNQNNQTQKNTQANVQNQNAVPNATNQSNQNMIQSLLGTQFSSLSAMDISSLYDSGLFTDLSSLNNSNQNANTNLILQQILTSLEELKQQQNTLPSSEKNVAINAQKDSQNFKERTPSILRFKINGYVLLDSLKTVFFSKMEPDGSFLLTCDRVYYLNQQERKETIYLLFKAVKQNGSTTTYAVVPTLMQDKENVNSFLYKMCLNTDIVAQKTGNLVAIHLNKENFSMDMLLDVDK